MMYNANDIMFLNRENWKEFDEWMEGKAVYEAFTEGERGSFLLHILVHSSNVDKRKLVLAAAHCANLVRHLLTSDVSKLAIDAAIEYGEDKIGEDELAYISKQAGKAAAGPALGFSDIDFGRTRIAAKAAFCATYGGVGAANWAEETAQHRPEMELKTAEIIKEYFYPELKEQHDRKLRAFEEQVQDKNRLNPLAE